LARILVVGGGITGLSSAWALRRDGHDVTLFDQARLPNPKGSSVDEHRLIRFPYGARPGYTRMVAEAYESWERVFADIGERPYAATGSLVMSSRSDGFLRESADCLASLGHAPLWLDRGELARRFPTLDASRVAAAFTLESGGVLLASRIVEALARRLRETGVWVREETPVARVDLGAATVELGDGATVSADALVVAAGPWVTRLVPDLQATLTPSRQVVVYLTPPDDLAAHWSISPLILDLAPEAGFYLVPPVLGTGLKIGDHRFSLPGDPDRDREASLEEAKSVASLAASRLRDFARYQIARAKTCFYTVEKDERFVVRSEGRGLVVSACSGHAFKFGSLIGERVADTVAGRWDVNRLARWIGGG
jgi:glycine/D-amino acid oxidase-like deaminating enzyme